MKRYLMVMLAGTLLMAGVTVGHAAPTDISDILTVFNPDGSVFASVSITEGEEEANPGAIPFINIPNLVDPIQFGNPTNLVEPDGTFSDIFGVASVGGGLFLAFNSDTEINSAPFAGVGTIFLPEGNGIHDATMYLDPAFQQQGFTAQFISDPAAVPEPSTIILMGLGMAGLVGWKLRQRRQRRA